MRVELAGTHFAKVFQLAKLHNATSISVQSYWTFCNFTSEKEANSFNILVQEEGMTTMGVNTERPFVPFEVAVHHPK